MLRRGSKDLRVTVVHMAISKRETGRENGQGAGEEGPADAGRAARPGHGGAYAILAICLGYFMVIMDATAVNLSLPQLGRELGGGLGVLQWVIDGYTLTFAAFLLSAGSIGDRLGARRMFVGGLCLFAGASVLCGLAPSAGVLVAARFVQGTGAAVLVPSSLALLQASFGDRAARARAVGLWGGIAGVAAASGPVIGGALTEVASWRVVFFANVPIGAFALALTLRHVVRPPGRGKGRLDPVAQLSVIGALGALTFGLIESRTRGWDAPLVLGAFAAAALLCALFVLAERRAASPMLPPELFSRRAPRGRARRAFPGGNLVGLLINLGFYGQLFVTALYFQDVRHYDALRAGLAILPEGIWVPLASFLSGRFTARRGTRPTMLLGLIIGAAGQFGLAVGGAHTPYGLLVVPLMAAGFGMAFTMPAVTTTVVEAAPPRHAGVASGAVNASRQMGSTIGVALLGTLAGGVSGQAAGPAAGMHAAMAAAGAAFLLGALVAALSVPRMSAAGRYS
jgi:DHA2 family methylenomycin A resistance protein-like MFS transporter